VRKSPPIKCHEEKFRRGCENLIEEPTRGSAADRGVRPTSH
jgi:hypothetical protein